MLLGPPVPLKLLAPRAVTLTADRGKVLRLKVSGAFVGHQPLLSITSSDPLVLPNGVTRDFLARMGGMDGNAPGKLDRNEGKVTADGNKTGDLKTIVLTDD